jgi:hypothetical protein
MVEESFVPTVFSHNRDRLIIHDAAGEFLRAIVEEARKAKLMSADHFTVDGTLIEAWASLKSFKKKDDDDKTPPDDPGNPTVDFHGEKRTNDTHESTTDPDAKLARKGKGKEAKLSYSAHALIENRNGLVLDLQMDVADGHAERRNALEMLDNNLPGQRRITVGGDKGYDTSDFVEDCRERNVTPHVAQNITKRRGSNIDERTTGHVGYAVSHPASACRSGSAVMAPRDLRGPDARSPRRIRVRPPPLERGRGARGAHRPGALGPVGGRLRGRSRSRPAAPVLLAPPTRRVRRGYHVRGAGDRRPPDQGRGGREPV